MNVRLAGVFVRASRVTLVRLGILTLCACASVDSKETSGAGLTPCPERATYSCASAPPDATRCVGDPTAADHRRELPTATSYAPGCFAYFRRTDCSTDGFCYCNAGHGQGAFWACQ